MTETDWRLRFTSLTLLVVACGCSALDNCPSAQDAITIDRPEDTDQDLLVFSSNGLDNWEKFDAFPAKTELRYKHHLGVVPYEPHAYLSFTKNATNGNDGGSFTEAAGNEVAWECMDSHTIVIKNDTCERSFFVKVVASGIAGGDANNDDCGE